MFRSDDVVSYMGGEDKANMVASDLCQEFKSKLGRTIKRDGRSFVCAAILSGELNRNVCCIDGLQRPFFSS